LTIIFKNFIIYLRKIKKKSIKMKCPFCNGCGILKYKNGVIDYYVSSDTIFEKCRTCNGNGIVDDHYYEKDEYCRPISKKSHSWKDVQKRNKFFEK